ncbi:SIMPL domain-containing protein [Bacillaceae bacterium W0354]
MYYPPQPSPYNPYRQDNQVRMMTVFGEGMVSVEPNVAKVRLGVVTQREDLTDAQELNAQTVNQVIQAMLNVGISRNDIQTADYNIRPEYDYVDGVQQFRGYVVTHILQVTIYEVILTGKVIDSAVSAGANRVFDISFTVRDEDQYVRIALNRALENAMSKARALASTINATLDIAPLKIEERIEAPPRLYKTFAQAEGMAGTTIEPGQLEIRAQIEAKYRFEA